MMDEILGEAKKSVKVSAYKVCGLYCLVVYAFLSLAYRIAYRTGPLQCTGLAPGIIRHQYRRDPSALSFSICSDCF